MPNHEPEILQGRAERITSALVGMNITEQLAMLGMLAGRFACTLPGHLRPQAFEMIGRAVQRGVETAPRA